MTTPTLIRAAELLEEEAEALFKSHTFAGEWEPSEHGGPAQKHHAELIEIASRLRAIQRGFESSDDYGHTLVKLITP